MPNRALIIIDVQNEYFDGPVLPIQHPARDGSLAKIVDAIDAAERARMPIVAVQHELPEDAPVFAKGSAAHAVHDAVEARATDAWLRSSKAVASVLADDALVARLREQQVDTLTLVGYMTNNCVLGTAAAAEPMGFAVEVLSDATGAIHLANEAGSASAQQVHETLMVLLHSNFAAVATTAAWTDAVQADAVLPKSDLGTSAAQGRAAFGEAAAA
ncbi:isochorismatase family protein [Agrococcus sp. ARC_14]|uniref:isochorismatase family protein n=1 Tax=Agrococcus sp. ARC_14 TaxID=2919927 RepID=UPI001F05DCAA|nr:isochorismatase family protein [Agrococcus sp. ARC_14]MCH1881426.1 isochorismatase family protein [Agrococcus sp. ARC_14]